jgi:hypothetical protein
MREIRVRLTDRESTMSSNFTVIIDQRQHFGDEPSDLPGAFVGLNKEYPFRCQNVDPRESAVLPFQTLSVSHERNFIAINSTGTGTPEVFGGIPVSGSTSNWTGNVMLVRPGVLQENNILRLGARASNGSLLGDVDDRSRRCRIGAGGEDRPTTGSTSAASNSRTRRRYAASAAKAGL